MMKKMNLKKVVELGKKGLFLAMLILTYFVTDRVVEYISTLDIILIKRVVNLILIVLVTSFYFCGNSKEEEKNQEIKKTRKH